MPDRLIRDELLTSERYWSVSIEAQRLFIHLLLVADDLARFSGKNFTVRSACFPGQAVAPEKVERMLSELQDLDLVRLYESSGERYIFIPRFGQRLRYKNSKFPAPPSEINDIDEEKSVSRPTVVVPQPDSSRQKRSEEKRSEEKRSSTSARRGSRLQPGFVPPDSWLEFCKEEREDLDPFETYNAFHDYWTSVPGQKGSKLDWEATWRNWVRNQREARKVR
jgi:hypothetical protein